MPEFLSISLYYPTHFQTNLYPLCITVKSSQNAKSFPISMYQWICLNTIPLHSQFCFHWYTVIFQRCRPVLSTISRQLLTHTHCMNFSCTFRPIIGTQNWLQCFKFIPGLNCHQQGNRHQRWAYLQDKWISTCSIAISFPIFKSTQLAKHHMAWNVDRLPSMP